MPDSVENIEKAFNGTKFDVWLGVILLDESNISFGCYFIPLNLIKEEYISKNKKGLECKVGCLIEEAKKHEFFFESKDFRTKMDVIKAKKKEVKNAVTSNK
jgi:hypothetical protein